MGDSAVGEMHEAAKENIDRTVSGLKSGIASATAGMEQAQAHVRENMQKAMRTAEEMFSFTQGNIEALTRCTQILTSGMQDMGQSVAATARASVDDTVNTFKALTAVKSVKEAIELQTGLFRANLERAVSQTSQLTDSTMKLSEQAIAPLSARVTLAAEKFGRIA
jgi:phasin family protein